MHSTSDSTTLRCLALAAALLTAACGSNTGDTEDDNNAGDGDTGDGDTGDGDTGDGDTGDGDTGDGDTGDGDVPGDGDVGDGDVPGDGDVGDGDTGDGDTGDGDVGDGDGDAPTSVCTDNSLPPVTALVSDLEDGVDGWDIYASTVGDMGMGAALVAPAGTFDDAPENAEGGANETTKSVHFAGTGWKTYGAGINYNLEGCKDLTEYTGVRFYAKGSSKPAEEQMPPGTKENALNFRVITAGSHAIIEVDGVNVGGDCDASVSPNKCFRPPQLNIELTPDWKLYEIKFTDLKTPAGANPGSAFDGTNAMLLGWHSDNADFDFFLDEVEFYK